MPWYTPTAEAAPPQLQAALEGGFALQQSGYRGAGFSEKTLKAWDRTNLSADAAILPAKRVLEGGSTDLIRNNGFAAGARQTYADNIIGPMGLRLSAKPDYVALGRDEAWAEEWAKIAESKFRTWANDPAQCDAAGVHDFADHQTISFFNTFGYGDAITLPLWLDEPGRKWNLALQGIQPARLRNPLGQSDAPNFRGGIQTNDLGKPLRFHFAKRNPDDNILAAGWDSAYATESVDAATPWGRRKVIHLVERTEFGQTRGIGALAPILAQFKQLDLSLDYEMKNQMLNTIIGMVIETPVEDLLGVFADPEKAMVQLSARKAPTFDGGGQVLQLRPGEKMTPFSPNRPGAQLEHFIAAFTRELCAALNIPYELFSKDFSKSSYVGIRAGLSEAVRFFTGKRFWLATGYCQPIYQLWLEEAVNRGEIEAPGYYENVYAYSKAKWLGARQSFTDRVKETNASVLAIENNLSTLEEEVSLSLGEDYRDVLAQRSREVKLCKEYELPTNAGPLAIAMASAPQTEPAADPANDVPPPQKKA